MRDTEPIKCVTDECENLTKEHLCDECSDAQLADYEQSLGQ